MVILVNLVITLRGPILVSRKLAMRHEPDIGSRCCSTCSKITSFSDEKHEADDNPLPSPMHSVCTFKTFSCVTATCPHVHNTRHNTRHNNTRRQRKKTEKEREEREEKEDRDREREEKTRRREQDKTKREERREKEKRQEMKEKMKDKTSEDERDKRGEQKIKRSTEDEAELSYQLSSVGELI